MSYVTALATALLIFGCSIDEGRNHSPPVSNEPKFSLKGSDSGKTVVLQSGKGFPFLAMVADLPLDFSEKVVLEGDTVTLKEPTILSLSEPGAAVIRTNKKLRVAGVDWSKIEISLIPDENGNLPSLDIYTVVPPTVSVEGGMKPGKSGSSLLKSPHKCMKALKSSLKQVGSRDKIESCKDAQKSLSGRDARIAIELDESENALEFMLPSALAVEHIGTHAFQTNGRSCAELGCEVLEEESWLEQIEPLLRENDLPTEHLGKFYGSNLKIEVSFSSDSVFIGGVTAETEQEALKRLKRNIEMSVIKSIRAKVESGLDEKNVTKTKVKESPESPFVFELDLGIPVLEVGTIRALNQKAVGQIKFSPSQIVLHPSLPGTYLLASNYTHQLRPVFTEVLFSGLPGHLGTRLPAIGGIVVQENDLILPKRGKAGKSGKNMTIPLEAGQVVLTTGLEWFDLEHYIEIEVPLSSSTSLEAGESVEVEYRSGNAFGQFESKANPISQITATFRGYELNI